VDHKKPPVLTSPWKVGFLGALMLVATGLGVGYLISNAFGIRWHWLYLGGISPADWSFDFNAFMDELVPLLALVALLAVTSHLLVANAVKAYTNYVDSGVEKYKQLLKSIKSIDDLEDEDRLDQLKKHPELREFLMGFKSRISSRERQSEEQEKRPDRTVHEAAPAPSNLPGECGLLVSAIMNGKAGFSRELALTIPELKQIERAAREHLLKDAASGDEIESLRRRLDSTIATLQQHGAGLMRDADACVNGVREMETQLAQLKAAIESNQDPELATAEIAKAAQQLDAMAEAMNSLGEETRRIAIVAALEASDAAQGESIRIAEELRTIAMRFNSVAMHWKQAGPALRAGLSTIEKGGAGNDKRRRALAAAAARVAGAAQMWSERLVALQEQIRELERALGIQMGADDTDEWAGIDTEEAAHDSTADTSEAVHDMAAGVLGETDEDDRTESVWEIVSDDEAATDEHEAEPSFQTTGAADVFEETEDDDAQFADIPGFEREQRVFSEQVSAGPGGEAALDDGLEVEPEPTDVYAEPATPAANTPVPPAENTADDEFLTGPRADRRPTLHVKPSETSSPADGGAPATFGAEVEADDEGRFDVTPDTEQEADADALDLYALGAVDFVAGVHA